MTKEEEEQKVAEDEAIQTYKQSLRGKAPPTTVAVYRAAFRAGARWAIERASKLVSEAEIESASDGSGEA